MARALPMPRLSAEGQRWQAQSDMRTLQDAAAIKADAARVKAASEEARRQMETLRSVARKAPPPKRK